MNQKNNNEEKSFITTSMIVVLLIGLVLGFGVGSWWSKRAANSSLTALDLPVELATTTDLAAGEVSTVPASSDLPASVSSAVAAPAKVSVALDKEAMPDLTLATVDNQPAGKTATVKNISVAKNSWVAVRDSLDGAIGNILGATKVMAGAHDNVSIKLMRGTVSGNNYFLVVYEDNGDGMFNYKIDQMLQQDGKIRVVPFSAL